MRRTVLACLCIVLAGCGRAARQPAPPPPTSPGAPAVGAATSLSIEQKRATFAQAHEAIAAQQYSQAAALLDPLCAGSCRGATCAVAYPELEDYCLNYLALSYSRSGDDATADALWARLASTQPQSLFAAQANLERARLLRRQGDLAGAQPLLAAARLSDDDAVAVRALIELAAIEQAAGSPAAAQADLLAARSRAPGSALGREAKQNLDVLRQQYPELQPSGAALEAEARLLLKEGDPAGAREAVDRLLATAPPAAQPGLLRLRADAEIASGQTDQALASLREIVMQYPNSPKAPEALFRYATLLWNRDRNDEARSAFLEFRNRYPDDERMPDVLYALARIEQGDGRNAEAMRLFEQLTERYPSAKVAREAGWRIGWIDYQEGRYREAAAAFGRAASGAGSSAAPESEYWQARSLERAGDREAADSLYRALLAAAPASYYAQLAEQRLGQPPPRAQIGAAPAPLADIGAPPPGADPYHWVRARELHAIGLRAPSRAELRAYEHATADDPSATAALLPAYQVVGGYRDAIRLGSARGYTDPAIFFPLAFWPQVSRSAGQNGTDPLLILALMRQESMFDPAARSPADARGLMQLLPSTAERTASNIGAPSPAGQLYDPDVNISLGVAHMQELLRDYGGDPVKVLAAYNAGPSAVAKWEARFGTLPPDEFVESITYRETRDYVKRVLGNYRRYQIEYAN